MKNNRLLIALVVLLGVGTLAVMASRSRLAATTIETPSETLPKLKKDDLTEIEIAAPGKPPLTLVKQGGTWGLTQPVAAKADTSSVDAVLDKLTSVEITGVAATRKENHARLQVDPATGIHVKAKAGSKVVLDVFVGASKGGSTMLRLDGKETVLAARGSLRYAFDKEVKQFRDRVITDIEGAELTAMTIESAKGTFRFDKADKTWAQAAKEKPIAEFSDAKVDSVASMLAGLRAADFADPGTTAESAGLTAPTAKATLTQKTGATTLIELGKLHENQNEYYVRATGKDVIFRVSKFFAERMLADATSFVADKKEAAKENEGPDLGAMAPGGEGAGGELSPEMMEQIKRQLANQGGHP